MTKQEARKLIEELLTELDAENVTRQFWMDKVQGYVQYIFGDSNSHIALPMFGTYYWDRPYSNWDATKIQHVIDKLRELFSTYLQFIDVGVIDEKRLTKLENRQTKLEDEQLKLARRGLFVNVAIAIATGVAAIYYILEISNHIWGFYSH